MASLITCPHCGSRPREEFSVRGAVAGERPALRASDETWFRHAYIRDNRIGRMFEYWHHDGGCRRFLVVERDNLSHDVFGVWDAAGFKPQERGK